MQKRQRVSCLLREGISFLWGIAKNYIMYWGVTPIILAPHSTRVKTHTSQIYQKQLLVFVHYAQSDFHFYILCNLVTLKECLEFLAADLLLLDKKG